MTAKGCFQCVKVIKFESNSQQPMLQNVGDQRCFQCVKVIKFESNSQLSSTPLCMVTMLFSVCQSYKV